MSNNASQWKKYFLVLYVGMWIMHNLFISCQVCHVREQEEIASTRFGWIDIVNGQLCSNPDMAEGVWGDD